ncbi:MAG: DUF503 domain-containing protein [Candidatus Sericytochromatia bacterium]|nr:DUF503 domain-containing protein [Candidatus Sericytochromatia bacterium]
MARLLGHLPAAGSLKDKRRVLRSVLERLRLHHHVAAAEVGGQDKWQRIEIGLAYVSGEAGHARDVMEAACRAVQHERPDVDWIVDALEIIDPLAEARYGAPGPWSEVPDADDRED